MKTCAKSSAWNNGSSGSRLTNRRLLFSAKGGGANRRHKNSRPERAADTKQAYGKKDGVQYYHVIQSFKPGEVTPELALEIATEFAREHLPGFETVISIHVSIELKNPVKSRLFNS